MTIKMPYGLVTINTIQDAVGFVLNHCKNCPYSNEMTSCSGAEAEECNKQVRNVINNFSSKRR